LSKVDCKEYIAMAIGVLISLPCEELVKITRDMKTFSKHCQR